jgi:Tol biopolymer transport system component
MTATFVEWHCFSDDDDVSMEFECLTDRTDFTAITTMDAVEIATDGTSVYYASDSTWTSGTVAHDDLFAVDFDTTDTPDYVHGTCAYWLNSDIN